MKKLVLITGAAALALSACNSRADEEAAAGAEAAAATIAGDWVVNLDTASAENAVESYLLVDGQYTCESCNPPFSYAADGEVHEVDRPGLDAVMMEVVDDNSVRTMGMFEGEETGNSVWTVSEDGSSMSIAWNNLRGEEAISGTTNYNRVGDAPDGAHAISGGWELAGWGDIDDAGLSFSISIDGDQYSSRGNGEGWTATVGGDAVVIPDNDAGDSVRVEATDNGYRETYISSDGEVVGVTELSLDADGNLVGVNTDPRDDSVVRWTASRAS
ncbi:hypothetical protein [Sphingomicrobium sediminis]|uniref:Lipoprotein n=1 Tax=Sphingomicrobium sediminis TaxID=2950949 RepID=A0A9X2EE25_9SPHN|nr:hypothetical protein [Sphingomicrobium sediminis]MCM8556260.1 hypothetical protein [Sphingomicrobium sediminis]